MFDQFNVHVSERRNIVRCLCEMHCHWAFNITVSNSGSVLRNSCFKWSGSFSDVGQATWASEHIDHDICFACHDTLDVERFSCSWVIESSGVLCKIAFWAVTISVIAMMNSL